MRKDPQERGGTKDEACLLGRISLKDKGKTVKPANDSLTPPSYMLEQEQI
jgi:hypothetical protein